VSFRRGAVWFVDLPDIGDKPVVIVSWQPLQDTLGAVIVARITSAERRRTLPTAVRLEASEGGLDRAGYVLCHHLVTRTREAFRRHVGNLPPVRMREVDAALGRALAL
jgi:mRNA-degrading endonuclease toxin of MazEF toxin-antitoxin module